MSAAITQHGLPQNDISLRRGARLRYAVHDHRGLLLLAQGAEITERVYTLLQHHGIALKVNASLKVTRGPGANQEIPIQGRMTIGRRPSCDVQLADPFVSGAHCSLHKRQLGVFLEDLGSSNGTFLNDQIIHARMELSDQDVIRIGGAIFTVQMHADLVADNKEASEAIKAWILTEPGKEAGAATSHVPTMMEFDLDTL